MNRSGGFFFLDTTKSWLHSDFFTVVFFLFCWILAFSRRNIMGRNLMKICLSVSMRIQSYVKFRLRSWRGARQVRYRIWFVTWSWDRLISSIMHVLVKISYLSINAVSIHDLQTYSSIDILDALKRLILKLSLIFCYLNIDLTLLNTAHASRIRTLTSCSLDPT